MALQRELSPGEAEEEPPSPIAPDVVVEDDRWQAAELDSLSVRALDALQRWLGAAGEIVVMGCDDARIAALNADFRGKPRATNVLSWPSVEHEPHDPGARPDLPEDEEWGDIAISFDTCAAEAEAQGKPLDHHVIHLLIHAGLHLVGYDHENDADAETMEAAERSILSTLDIPDPYSESAS